MDVDNGLNINEPSLSQVQSSNGHQEVTTFCSSLGLKYIREVAEQIHINKIYPKDEVREATTEPSRNSFNASLPTKRENCFENDSDVKNINPSRNNENCLSKDETVNPNLQHTLKTEQFNDLCSDALQVQLNERHFKEGVCLKYFCSFCTKGFAKKQQLQNHIKTHTNEKNFQCEICDKRFVHKQQLTNHEKTHTGKKDFECAFCNKRFILKQQMQIHSKIHTGEKNFECNMCDKRFITKQQLQNHINSHLGVKPFSCDVCQKHFAHKQQLLRHEAHHEKQIHYCVMCNLKFKGKSLLASHLSTVHPMSNSESICNISNSCL